MRKISFPLINRSTTKVKRNKQSFLAAKKTTTSRSKIFLILFSLLYIALISRVLWLNYAPYPHRGTDLRQEASEVWSRVTTLHPERGKIYDRNGKPLATNTRADSVLINNNDLDGTTLLSGYEDDPTVPRFKNKEELAQRLAEIYDYSYETVWEILNDYSLDFVYLARIVTPEQFEQTKALRLKGISFTHEPLRIYPLNDFGSSYLGFAGYEMDGKNGLEFYYNDLLKGTAGESKTVETIIGDEFPLLATTNEEAIGGSDIYLTIDEQLQTILDKELKYAVELNLADGGAAIIMDPYTSEILALSSYPGYNINDTPKLESIAHRNPIISDSFEPGSTFKIVTCLAALELGYSNEYELFNDPGYYQIGPDKIWNWDKGADHGLVSLLDAMRSSSNVVMGQLGLRIGAEKLIEFQKRLGFGELTGIDFPGESYGLLFEPEDIRDVELFTSAFGQGPSVTPLQQINAFNAIINGGILNEPHFVKSYVNSEGQETEYEIVEKGRVISEESSSRMRAILDYVLNAPGSQGASKLFHLAGKTGTANKYNPNTGGYYEDIYIASTIGFAPADNPLYTIYIYLDNPHGPNGYYGGQTAAPAFRRIAEEILKVSGYLPDELEKAELTDSRLSLIPEYRGLTQDEILKLLEKEETVFWGNGEIVIAQYPQPGSYRTKGEIIRFLLGKIDEEDPFKVEVPNFTGLSLAEVVSLGQQLGLHLITKGQGTSQEQTIPAQTMVTKGSSITVTFN